jgi:Ankyrin repeats (many copies)/Ankyrin repeat
MAGTNEPGKSGGIMSLHWFPGRGRHFPGLARAAVTLAALVALAWGTPARCGAIPGAARVLAEASGGSGGTGQAAAAQPSAGMGRIYFYRRGRFLGMITHFSVYVGDKFLAEIHNDTYASMEVPAGPVVITAGSPITGKRHLPSQGEWASLPGCAGLEWRRLPLEPAGDVNQCAANLRELNSQCEGSSSTTTGGALRTLTIHVPACNYKLHGSYHANELLAMVPLTVRLPLEVEAGKIYYVRWSLALTNHPLAYKLELMDEATGAKEMKGASLAKETDEGNLGQLTLRLEAIQPAATNPVPAAQRAPAEPPPGRDDIFRAAKEGDVAKVRELLEKDPELVTRRDRGSTALHSAVVYHHLEVVKVLLASGADVNAQDNGRMTPLHYAAVDGLTEIAEFLIENWANVNARQRNGLTPLHMAIMEKHKETAEVIKKHGGKK